MNIKKMMRQAQEAQDKILEQIQAIEVTGTAGGGMVTAVLTGNNELKSIQINPEVVNPQDVEMLQDLILAAVSEAHGKAEEKRKDIMSSAMGGLNIPGL